MKVSYDPFTLQGKTLADAHNVRDLLVPGLRSLFFTLSAFNVNGVE